MVECESWNHEIENPVGWVLIDTWWNVNEYFGKTPTMKSPVLIDTWWNVNFLRKLFIF